MVNIDLLTKMAAYANEHGALVSNNIYKVATGYQVHVVLVVTGYQVHVVLVATGYQVHVVLIVLVHF